MTAEILRDMFYEETNMEWQNSQGEPDIYYIWWLEAKILANKNFIKSVVSGSCLNCGNPIDGKGYCSRECAEVDMNKNEGNLH